MLHIDRNTQQFLDLMDEGFKSTPKISEGLSRELTKVFGDIDKEWNSQYKRIKRGLQSFENKLVKALSDPLPSKFVGELRPANRKFPYMNVHSKSNEPHLANTYWRSIQKADGDNSMTITIDHGFTSLHAYLTNENITKAGRNNRNVSWLNWVDKVLGESPAGTAFDDRIAKHSYKVPDIRSVLIGIYS